jgi:hypothetical protein
LSGRGRVSIGSTREGIFKPIFAFTSEQETPAQYVEILSSALRLGREGLITAKIVSLSLHKANRVIIWCNTNLIQEFGLWT